MTDSGSNPTVAERLAATRVAHAWLTVHHVEVLLAREAVGTPGRAAVEKDLGRAEARPNAALKGLAVLRRLRGPWVRLTQVNVAGAERVVVRWSRPVRGRKSRAASVIAGLRGRGLPGRRRVR